MNENENNVQESKENEYYSALINAWITSKLELDKSLLYLSTSAVGLLFTLLTVIKSTISVEMLIIYFASIISFILCMISILLIFHQNPRYIEDVIKDKKEGNDKVLSFLDKLAIFSFLNGVILAFLFTLMFVIIAKGGIK